VLEVISTGTANHEESVKISREDVLRVAELLSRLSEAELESTARKLTEILEYIGKLKRIGPPPTSSQWRSC